MSEPGFRRRLAAFSVVAIAAVLIGAGVPTSASAAITLGPPSMTVNHGWVKMAVDGPDHSLMFYDALNGTTTWYAETVAGPGTTYSPPDMIINGNYVNIVAVGPGGVGLPLP